MEQENILVIKKCRSKKRECSVPESLNASAEGEEGGVDVASLLEAVLCAEGLGCSLCSSQVTEGQPKTTHNTHIYASWKECSEA